MSVPELQISSTRAAGVSLMDFRKNLPFKRYGVKANEHLLTVTSSGTDAATIRLTF